MNATLALYVQSRFRGEGVFKKEKYVGKDKNVRNCDHLHTNPISFRKRKFCESIDMIVLLDVSFECIYIVVDTLLEAIKIINLREEEMENR